MTTAHKTILSLVATICITLIVFYSIKGNADHPGSGSPGTSAPAMSTTGANSNARGSTDSNSGQSPVVIARADGQKPAGIDDIMAKVKHLDEMKSGSASAEKSVATETNSRPAPALSNTPASTETPVVSLTEASSTERAVPPTESAPTPIPDPAPSSPAANSAAAVPSLTIGEPTAPSSIEAKSGEKPKSVFDTDIKDLTDLPVIESPHPVPALAKVEPASESSSAKDNASTSAPAPTATASDENQPAKSAAVTPKVETPKPEPKVIVVDPHKPAVSTDAADSTAARPAAKSNEAAAPTAAAASTNTPAEAAKPAAPKLDIPYVSDRTNATAPRSYTIKPGDTFSSIAIAIYGAEKHWIDIADANPGIDAKKVRVGQVIKLPVIDKDDAKPADAKVDVKPDAKAEAKIDAKSAAKTTATKAEPAKIESRIHEVKAGENLISISRRYFKTPDNWRHVYLTNRELIGGDPAKLHAGMKLKITPPPLED